VTSSTLPAPTVPTGPTAPTVPTRARARATASRVPTLREERRVLRDGAALVAGIDEVGRGALAGPVTVGVVIVNAATRTAPSGLRDSKLLTPAAREALAPRLRRWAVAWADGHAQPAEIDAFGIMCALRLAGTRALAQLPEPPDVVLLDGSYDWLTRPSPPLVLFGADELTDAAPAIPPTAVRTLVKGDLRCAAVAAASVLAKTARDAIMTARATDHPRYGWTGNKGYSAPEHLAALATHGPCPQHRRSWRLPGCGEPADDAPLPVQEEELPITGMMGP
jgi:ribonuclease HII